MPRAGWGKRRERMPEGKMEQREGKLAGGTGKQEGGIGTAQERENSGRMGAPGRNATAGWGEC